MILIDIGYSPPLLNETNLRIDDSYAVLSFLFYEL